MVKMKLQIVLEELCDYQGETEIEISDEKFKQLCQKYGVYGIDWYVVDGGFIKFWDGKKWDYIRWF